MNRRAAIQLSMNFLVTILIALVMLGAGIMLLRNFVSFTEDTQTDVDARTQEKLAVLLDQGDQIAIPFSRQTLKRGDNHIFPVGVLNILEPPVGADQTEFEILITLSAARDKDDNNLIVDLGEWLSYVDDTFSLTKNKHQITKVLVTVPNDAKSGTYIFNVKVITNGEKYDNIRKITIEVP